MSEKVVWDSQHEYPTEYVVSTYNYFEWTDNAAFLTKDEAISYARTMIRTAKEEEDIENLRARVTKVVKDW